MAIREKSVDQLRREYAQGIYDRRAEYGVRTPTAPKEVGPMPFGALSEAQQALAPGGYKSTGIDMGAAGELVRRAYEAPIPQEYIGTELGDNYENNLRELSKLYDRRAAEREEFSRMAGTKASPYKRLDTSTLKSYQQKLAEKQQADQKYKDEAPQRVEAAQRELESEYEGLYGAGWVDSKVIAGGKEREYITPEGETRTQVATPYGTVSVTGAPSIEDRNAKLRKQQEEEYDYQNRMLNARLAGREIGARIAQEQQKKLDESRMQREEDKANFARGERMQRNALHNITLLNRARRNKALTADQLEQIDSDIEQLRNIVSARETLAEKGVTELGRQGELNRMRRIYENTLLSRAQALNAAASSNVAAQTAAQYAPNATAMMQYIKSLQEPISLFGGAK